MSFSIRRVGRLVSLALPAFAVALACASGPPKQDDSFYTSKEYEQAEEHKPPPPDPCKGERGEPRECRSNDDCCEGYLCSVDADRSRILRYCLEG
jgi:hypothetical protein